MSVRARLARPLLATPLLSALLAAAFPAALVRGAPPVDHAAHDHAAHAPASTPAGDDATVRHPFSDVKRWSGVFDDPARDGWQRPEALVAALELRPGLVVADLGAGTGYFERRLSEAVGPTGRVLAVEVEPNLVAHLRERAAKEGTANVDPVLASPSDPGLPQAGVDLVLMIDTYHHVDGRIDYFRRLRGALRPGGRVAIVDWKKEPLPVGPPPQHKLERSQVVDEMSRAGYALERAPDVLPYQYFLMFLPR